MNDETRMKMHRHSLLPRPTDQQFALRSVTWHSSFTLSLLCVALLVCLPPSAHAGPVIKAQPKVKVAVPEEQLTDAELVQQLMSNFLVECEKGEVKDYMEQMNIVIGDVHRVVGLPAERQRMLELAAKGTVDRALEGWRSTQENQVRQQAQGLTPEIVEQRLQNLGSVHVGNESIEKNALWTSTVARVLTPDELAKWKKAEEDRKSYRTRALAQMLVAELDRQVGLTLTQSEKLEPLAMQSLNDYLPDMSNYVDRNSGIDFRMLLLMLSGAPQNEVQGVLTPDQYGKWQQVTADYRGWWQSIEQNHRTRLSTGGTQPQQKQNGLILQGGGRIIINGGGLIKQ